MIPNRPSVVRSGAAQNLTGEAAPTARVDVPGSVNHDG